MATMPAPRYFAWMREGDHSFPGTNDNRQSLRGCLGAVPVGTAFELHPSKVQLGLVGVAPAS